MKSIRVTTRYSKTDRGYGSPAPLIDHELWDFDPIRQAELTSIEDYVRENAHYLTGRVLDYGAGKPGTCRKPQPYRHLLTSAYEYCPFDKGDELAGPYDSILCTQVLHMVGPVWLLKQFRNELLNPGGYLVMTYPTNWCVIENEDLFRYTQHGMERMLADVGGWRIVNHERRAEVLVDGFFSFPLGCGIVAQAT